MIKEKSKIDFDYEVKKIYKEKFYDSLEECIKDFEFPKNSDEIYVDEKDFKIAFKDTKYIKKLTLDFKSFAELYKNNFSSLIVIFHVNKDISLFEISDIMENFNNNLPKETQIIFGSKFFDTPKDEQKIELYFNDTKRESLEKFKYNFTSIAPDKSCKKENDAIFTNYENIINIRELGSNDLKEVFELIINKNFIKNIKSYDDFVVLIKEIKEKNDYKMFGLFVDDTLVCYAGVSIQTTLYYKKHLFINELNIMFEYDENYSSQMIDFLSDFALKNNCHYLVTYDVYKHENIYFYRFLERNKFIYGDFFRYIKIK
ncbi:GNAT family N-acetyltransferase [Aliarcobacter cryaerophilus]|uniref:GNAT family N-acetyltransferase n=1 Tax=Aliarcobacter cryaerophilus TaxID=28198 RepID=UPI000825F8EC|nr:GNAT family N-acetyltransferase [Aliarcobacter cryaerophilus]